MTTRSDDHVDRWALAAAPGREPAAMAYGLAGRHRAADVDQRCAEWRQRQVQLPAGDRDCLAGRRSVPLARRGRSTVRRTRAMPAPAGWTKRRTVATASGSAGRLTVATAGRSVLLSSSRGLRPQVCEIQRQAFVAVRGRPRLGRRLRSLAAPHAGSVTSTSDTSRARRRSPRLPASRRLKASDPAG
jgi:hypothetical protein